MKARGYIDIALVIASLIGGVVTVAKVRAHDAHLYDADCCGNGDCEPVLPGNVTFASSGPASLPVMTVTTSLGTKSIDPQTKVRQSKDGRMHACIYSGRLYCLYLPPGN